MKKTLLLFVMLMILLAACGRKPDAGSDLPQAEGPGPEAVEINSETTGNNNDTEYKSVIKKAAWCVYWDQDPADDTDRYSQYRDLVLFGCIYSEDNNLYIPEKLEELISKYRDGNSRGDHEIYISFVNDVMHPDGSATQKSEDFLQNVLTDAESSDRIIDDMIKQTKELGFDGIELDYENIHKCDDLWDEYMDFVSGLYSRTVSENLKLRVVLAVSTPVNELNLIEGPQYVVMCYNLFGNHSGPGPKADEEFLKNTYNKFKSIDADYALANGGFEWGPDDRTIRSLTAADAAALAEENGAEINRDNSGALNFVYESEDGIHTVFYGDEQTIEYWSKILSENADKDIGINLWRLE